MGCHQSKEKPKGREKPAATFETKPAASPLSSREGNVSRLGNQQRTEHAPQHVPLQNEAQNPQKKSQHEPQQNSAQDLQHRNQQQAQQHLLQNPQHQPQHDPEFDFETGPTSVAREPNPSFESVGCPWQEVEETFVPIDLDSGAAIIGLPAAARKPDTARSPSYIRPSPFEVAAVINGSSPFEDASDRSSNSGSNEEGDPLLTKPGLDHVLALLERLVSARALLVDLRHPPAAYVRDSQGLRRGDPVEVRSLPHYQEVNLPGHVSGTLGAATPAANPTALLLLTQMAGVVARELGVAVRPPPLSMQQQESLSQMGHAMSLATALPAMSLATQRAASECGLQLGSLLVDATNGAWRILEVEKALVTVTGLAADEWVGTLVWELLKPPFGGGSAAWYAVNEVAALAGDLIVTGVTLPPCTSHATGTFGGLALQCTPASELALQAAGHAEWQSAAAEASQGISEDRLPYLATLVRDARDRGDSSRTALRADSGCAMLSPLGLVPVPGVELGEQLGKGSYGRVFLGSWHGEEVAIKICHQGLARSGDRKVKPWAGVEAVASLQLRHRHVMRTLKHTTVVVPAAPTWSSSASASMSDSTRPSLDLSRLSLPSVKAPSAGPVAAAAACPACATPAFAATREQPGGIRVLSLPSVPRPPNQSQLAESAVAQLPVPEEAAVVAVEDEAGDPQPSHASISAATVARGHVSSSGGGGGGAPRGPGRPDSPKPGSQSMYTGTAALRGAAASGNPGDAPLLQRTPSASGFGAASLGGSPHAAGGVGGGGDVHAEIDTYVIMEYCNRGSLQRALEDGMFSFGGSTSGSSDLDDRQPQQQQAKGRPAEEPPPPRRPDMLSILTAGHQLASALAYMHSRGVIHGDLSRANVLLQESTSSSCGFDVKVADFGMARQLEVGSRIDTFSCGTITHSAPELMDEGRLSPAVDVFAIGVLLWELYHGRGAWTGMNQAQVISAVLIHNKRPHFESDAPRKFAALSEQCMASDPHSRPTCMQVESRLADMLEGLAEPHIS